MKMPTRPRIQEVRTPKLKKKFVKGSEPPEKIAGSRKFPQPKGIDGAVGGVKK